MALIKCPECQCEVSDKSAWCVGCGYPINKAAEKEKKPVISPYTYQSSSGNYLRSVGIATWVLGGIAAVGLSLTFDRWGDVDGINFLLFLLYAAIFFVAGLVPRCFAEFFDDVHTIRCTLQGVATKEEKAKYLVGKSGKTVCSFCSTEMQFENLQEEGMECPHCKTQLSVAQVADRLIRVEEK